MQVQIGSKQITCGKLKLSIMYTHLGCNDLFSTNTLLILGDCVKKCHQNTETVRDQAHCSLPKKLLNQQLFCAWLTKSDHWIRSWERKSRGAWLQLKVGSRFSITLKLKRKMILRRTIWYLLSILQRSHLRCEPSACSLSITRLRNFGVQVLPSLIFTVGEGCRENEMCTKEGEGGRG